MFKQGCHALRETKGSFDFFSENFREVVRLKKKFQRIFFDLEWDLVNPVSIFVRRCEFYLFLSAYLEFFSLVASSLKFLQLIL